MKKPYIQISLGIAFGTALGAAVATILGSGGLWLAAGIAIGIVIGSAIARPKSVSAVLSAGNK
jgi:hypothetical protein